MFQFLIANQLIYWEKYTNLGEMFVTYRKTKYRNYSIIYYCIWYIYIYFNNWCLLRIAIIKETVTHHLTYALNHSFCCIYKFFHTTVWWVSHGKLLNVWPTWTTGEIWLWIVEAGRWADVRHWLNMGGKGLAYSS